VTVTKILTRSLPIVLGLSLLLGAAQAQDCNGIDRPIVFAGLDWNSAQVSNAIVRHILEQGFACATDDIPGSTIPMVQGLLRGDIDVNMEIWFNTAPESYHEAVAAGDIFDLGLSMSAAELSFLVPRYMIEGDPERGIEAMAPGLRSVFDLAEHAALFQDPEEPDKGRYYNCIIGWQCELINNDKMKTYGLEEHFTNFRPGAAPALAASLAGAYEKGEAWLGYYWGPTPLLGLYEMVPLEEPAWTQECWDGDGGCAFRPSIVNVAVSKGFADEASEEMIAFLSGYEVDQMMVSAYLAHQSSTDAEWADVAREFLMNEAGVWTAWVSDEVASRVQAALDG
jgi:ABC-type proline/glycine betaine transport system substrate-binding protein